MIKTVIASVILFCSVFVTSGFAQSSAAQNNIDEKTLMEYFKDNKIKAMRAPSGLYYVINKPGTGANAKAGQNVSMKYYGKFMDGKRFDANMDADYGNCTRPLNFVLGTGRVIRGWDEGIQLLNPGTRATLYIPSSLGYGASAMGPIPANTILVFDVELISAQ